MRTQITVGALVLSALASCNGVTGKTEPTDQITEITEADAKADLPASTIRLLGTLSYGQTSNAVPYSGRSLAYQFTGNAGDKVTIDVKSNDGDALAFLYNDGKKRLAFNDDASSLTTDSHISFTLTPNASASNHTYYIVFREYSSVNAHFTVSLQGPAPAVDYRACTVDADCIAVPLGGCCHNGYKDAVNKNHLTDYDNATHCANPHPICPLFLILDRRVAQCNSGTQQCEMVDPQGQSCGGFTRNPHHCAPGYKCVLSSPAIPDVPGTCAQTCGGIAGRTCDNLSATCVDDPTDSCDPARGGADCGGICRIPSNP